MSRERNLGTSFESATVAYFRERLGTIEIYRAALSGKLDEGDVRGLRLKGLRCCVECKNCKAERLPQWREELEAERGNGDYDVGILVMHRKGCGEKRFGENWVEMTLEDLLAVSFGLEGVTHSSAREVWVRLTLDSLMEAAS